MINNLLDLAQLKRVPAISSFARSGRSSCCRPRQTLSPARQDQDVELMVSTYDLPRVAVDSRMLNHALRNLLDNALTYTERGGRVTLTASCVEDSVTISVADSGAGIPSEYVPHVFDRFFRVPGRSRGGGTGLGLAIVREIAISGHGGSVACTSQPGVGTTFRLTLPIWQDASSTIPQSSSPASVV